MRGALEIPGVSKIDVDEDTAVFSIHYDPAKVKPDAMIKLVHEAGEETVKLVQ